MRFDLKQALKWLKDTATVLPGIDQVLKSAASKVLVIGAGVFDIYNLQGWIPPLKRKTGDLDLSVGLVSGQNDYDVLKESLLTHGYKNGTLPYRYFSPQQIPGALTYVGIPDHLAEWSSYLE